MLESVGSRIVASNSRENFVENFSRNLLVAVNRNGNAPSSELDGYQLANAAALSTPNIRRLLESNSITVSTPEQARPRRASSCATKKEQPLVTPERQVETGSSQ